MGMTFGQFSEANRARCESPQGFKHPLNGWSTSDWITATMGELGEAANVVKKLNRYRDGVPGNKVSEAELRDQLRKELGDVRGIGLAAFYEIKDQFLTICEHNTSVSTYYQLRRVA